MPPPAASEFCIPFSGTRVAVGRLAKLSWSAEKRCSPPTSPPPLRKNRAGGLFDQARDAPRRSANQIKTVDSWRSVHRHRPINLAHFGRRKTRARLRFEIERPIRRRSLAGVAAHPRTRKNKSLVSA